MPKMHTVLLHRIKTIARSVVSRVHAETNSDVSSCERNGVFGGISIGAVHRHHRISSRPSQAGPSFKRIDCYTQGMKDGQEELPSGIRGWITTTKAQTRTGKTTKRSEADMNEFMKGEENGNTQSSDMRENNTTRLEAAKKKKKSGQNAKQNTGNSTPIEHVNHPSRPP